MDRAERQVTPDSDAGQGDPDRPPRARWPVCLHRHPGPLVAAKRYLDHHFHAGGIELGFPGLGRQTLAPRHRGGVAPLGRRALGAEAPVSTGAGLRSSDRKGRPPGGLGAGAERDRRAMGTGPSSQAPPASRQPRNRSSPGPRGRWPRHRHFRIRRCARAAGQPMDIPTRQC